MAMYSEHWDQWGFCLFISGLSKNENFLEIMVDWNIFSEDIVIK